MAPRLRSAVVRFDTLPEPVLRILFLALPVDERARAACVCRSWRAFLADPSLWQVLHLTPAGGVARERATENLARGAVARAGGQLRVLSLDRHGAWSVKRFLLELVATAGAALQEVSSDACLSIEDLGAVFAAAPQLRTLDVDVIGPVTELFAVLRKDPPYGPLRLRGLLAVFGRESAERDVLVLAAAVAAHESLKRLGVSNLHFARGLNALVDAAAERRITLLRICEDCVINAETVPALARLLQRNSLIKLDVDCQVFPYAGEASLLALCAALRACRTLTRLTFSFRPPLGVSSLVFTELLDAAAALPALSHLDFCGTWVPDTIAFGRALGALLRANLPSLRSLRVRNCYLNDDGLAPLLDGLTANTHLRELDCGENNVSPAFERDQLAPALAALAARAELDD